MVDEKTKLRDLEMLSGETLYFRNTLVRAFGMNPRRRRSNEMSVGAQSRFQQLRVRMSNDAEAREEVEMCGVMTSTKA